MSESAPYERRLTNRRRDPAQNTSPPYFDVFARIADALESIERTLRHLPPKQ